MYGYGMDGSGVSQGRADHPKEIAPPLPSYPLGLPHLPDAVFSHIGIIFSRRDQRARASNSVRVSLTGGTGTGQGWEAVGDGRSRGKPDPCPEARSTQQPGAGAAEQPSPWETRQQHHSQWVSDFLKSS